MSTTNAKTLFLAAVGSDRVAAVYLKYDSKHDGRMNLHLHDVVAAQLAEGFTQAEWDEFLACIDTEVESDSYGCGLSGTVWLEDGSWADCVSGRWQRREVGPRKPDVTWMKVFERERN